MKNDHVNSNDWLVAAGLSTLVRKRVDKVTTFTYDPAACHRRALAFNAATLEI
jgi:hypothetical protein